MIRKEANYKARQWLLTGPERRKGVSLEWDEELQAWVKNGTEKFNEKRNEWESL